MFWLFGFITIFLDQITKFFAADFAEADLLFCKLIKPTLNKGGVFSLPMPNLILAGITIILIGAIFFWRQKKPSRHLGFEIGTGLVIGGGISNLFDRIYYQGVVDFIACPHWPVFNIADTLIVIGVALLILFAEKPTSK